MECVICLLPCPPRGDPNERKAVVKFLQQIKKTGSLSGVQNVVDRLSAPGPGSGSTDLCGDCLGGITRATEWREQMTQLEDQMKTLQRMLGRMNNNYLREVQRLEGKSSRSKVTKEQRSEAAAESNGFIPEECEESDVFIPENVVKVEVEEEIELEVDPLIYPVKEEPQDHPGEDEVDPLASISLLPYPRPKPKPKKRRSNPSPNSKTSCPYCKKSFAKSPKYLADHINIHTGARPYQCTDCPLTFSGKLQLISHKREHGRGYKCLQCGKVFGWKKSLEHHQTLHQEKVEIYKCNFCPMEFPSSGALTRHVRRDHKPIRPARVALPKKKRAPRPSMAPQESFQGNPDHLESSPVVVQTSSSSSGALLKCHKRKWNFTPNSRRFGPCPYCGMKFKSEASLKYHVNTHTGGNRFQCDLCPKIYSSQYVLKLHRNNHFIFNNESKDGTPKWMKEFVKD